MTLKIERSCPKQNKFIDLNKCRQIFQDFLCMNHILSSCLISRTITLPVGEIFQVNKSTFIECISMPTNPIGNVLIIKGGVKHIDPNSFYIRLLSMVMDKNIRLFLFEKYCPVLNFDFGHDIASALTFINKQFSGPTAVIGFSMGGELLLSYLAMGYDQADLYMPVCCAIDLYDFENTIMNNWIFRYVQRCEFENFGVKNKKELLKLSGTNLSKMRRYMKSFIHNLNSTIDSWFNKTIYIVGSKDPISNNYDKWLVKLKRPLLTYVVDNGMHCCLNTVFLTGRLSSNYLRELYKGKCPSINRIKCE